MKNLRKLWKLAMGMSTQAGEINIALIAAGVAFYGMLALFPALAATLALWGEISDQDVVLEQLELMRNVIPAEVFTLVRNQVVALTSSTGQLGWAGVFSLLLAIWSARSGVAALILGLNTIHAQKQRSSIRHYLTAITLTVALIGVGLVTLATVVILPVVLSFVPLGPIASVFVELGRWGAAVGALMVGLGLVYRYGPNNRGDRMSWATPGSLLAVVFWGAASWGFSYYLSNFGNYNEVYGSLGAAVAMLFWLYITALLILVGAVLNVQLDRIWPDQPEAQAAKPGASDARKKGSETPKSDEPEVEQVLPPATATPDPTPEIPRTAEGISAPRAPSEPSAPRSRDPNRA